MTVTEAVAAAVKAIEESNRASVLGEVRAMSIQAGRREIRVVGEYWTEVFDYVGGELEEYRLIENVRS